MYMYIHTPEILHRHPHRQAQPYVYMYVYITCFHIHLCLKHPTVNKTGALLSINLVKQSDTSLSSMKSGMMTLRFRIITVAEVIGTLVASIYRQLARAQKFAAALNGDSN